MKVGQRNLSDICLTIVRYILEVYKIFYEYCSVALLEEGKGKHEKGL